MSEIEENGLTRSDFKLSGPTAFVFANPSGVLLTLKVDGSYELGGTVEELLAHDQPICRAFGAALRDQYEAGRQSVPAPRSGRA
jgi:hypothetical protein